MKKKVLSLLLVAAMGISMLVGCGGGTDKDTEANNSQGTGEPTEVTLTVWAPENQQELLKTQMAEFEKAHPEYKITWKTANVGEDNAKTEVLKDVAAAADVFFYANDQVQDLVKAGAIARLGGDTEKMVNDTMAAAVVDTVKVNGALYGIPFTHNTFFMYYDKTLLNEEEVKSLDKILAKDLGEGVFNFKFDDGGGWKLGAWYYGAGLSVFGADGSDLAAGCDWNSATGVEVTKYLINMLNNKSKVNTETGEVELIKEHKLAAWFDGSWNYETYKAELGENLGVATIPTYTVGGKEVQMKGFYGSKAIGVNAQSKNIKAATEFAAYLGSEEQQIARFTATGTVPTNKAAAETDAVKNDMV
ncbi:MAG: extracellular solute-binding protein, partial [Agathobacter sp.]|nr:extracellular solute-binding protein [Agathobacter sp.]